MASTIAKVNRSCERSHRTMEAIKSFGSALLGILAFVGIIIIAILFFSFGAKVAFTIAPFINWLAGILFFLNIIGLLAAIIPSARSTAGVFIFISSYVYGLSLWIYGLAVTLAFWGWIAVIIGLLLGGIGVVPIGMLAAIFNKNWGIFWTLLLMFVLTYAARIIGMMLAESSHEEEEKKQIIDVEPEKNTRSWKDIE